MFLGVNLLSREGNSQEGHRDALPLPGTFTTGFERARTNHDEEVGQADTKDLTSSSKFSASCVLTLQTLLKGLS